ncbi:MAG TPA: beta-ketoacyl-ACP synthase II [Planctomycetota bacterium]|nr:beta-ketoacyl-ACP synthase II [Planctomycetota bacterium]
MTGRRVVVTGLGCLSPAGHDVKTTWDAFLAGHSAVESLESLKRDRLACTIGAPVRGFDPAKLGSRQDVDRMGKSSQFALAAALEAFRDARIEGTAGDRTRWGCIIGTGIGDAEESFQQVQNYVAKGPRGIHPLYVTKVMPNAQSGMLSVEFGLSGPVFTIAAACASGGSAIAQAQRLIRHGEADLMLAGGVEQVLGCSMHPASFDAVRALSRRNAEPTLASRPFDRDRDGFVMGEGAGMLVLEDLDHAVRRGARIYAEIAGAGITSDAFHQVAPNPTGDGAARAMALALADAGWTPQEVQHINAHGTSTPLNDRIETLAIHKVFGTHAPRLAVSAIKSMIGHTIGASAAIAAIATVLSIQDEKVPPTINLDHPDPDCDLDYVPHRARALRVDRGLVNAFGFGGHCVSVAIGRISLAMAVPQAG